MWLQNDRSRMYLLYMEKQRTNVVDKYLQSRLDRCTDLSVR